MTILIVAPYVILLITLIANGKKTKIRLPKICPIRSGDLLCSHMDVQGIANIKHTQRKWHKLDRQYNYNINVVLKECLK